MNNLKGFGNSSLKIFFFLQLETNGSISDHADSTLVPTLQESLAVIARTLLVFSLSSSSTSETFEVNLYSCSSTLICKRIWPLFSN